MADSIPSDPPPSYQQDWQLRRAPSRATSTSSLGSTSSVGSTSSRDSETRTLLAKEAANAILAHCPGQRYHASSQMTGMLGSLTPCHSQSWVEKHKKSFGKRPRNTGKKRPTSPGADKRRSRSNIFSLTLSFRRSSPVKDAPSWHQPLADNSDRDKSKQKGVAHPIPEPEPEPEPEYTSVPMVYDDAHSGEASTSYHRGPRIDYHDYETIDKKEEDENPNSQLPLVSVFPELPLPPNFPESLNGGQQFPPLTADWPIPNYGLSSSVETSLTAATPATPGKKRSRLFSLPQKWSRSSDTPLTSADSSPKKGIATAIKNKLRRFRKRSTESFGASTGSPPSARESFQHVEQV